LRPSQVGPELGCGIDPAGIDWGDIDKLNIDYGAQKSSIPLTDYTDIRHQPGLSAIAAPIPS